MDAGFNITRRCNKACSYCYLFQRDEDLPRNTIEQIVARSHPETVSLTGGEPLLHPDVFDILDLLSEHSCHIHLLTNGLLLQGNVIRKIASRSVELFVTCNTCDHAVIENMMAAHAEGVRINVHHVLTTDHAGELAKLMPQIGFAHSICFLYPTAFAKANMQMHQPTEWLPLLCQALEIAHANDITAFFEQSFASRDSDLARNPQCLAGRDIFIDTDGLAYPCCLLVDSVRGQEQPVPVPWDAASCPFLRQYHLPPSSDFVRLCPIALSETFDGPGYFPSRLEH